MNLDSLVHAAWRSRFGLYAVACFWWPATVLLCAGLELLHRPRRRPISPAEVALVTGGSRGLGSEIVSLLAKRCHVYVLDVEEPSTHGVSYLYCDLASVEQTEKTISQLVSSLARQNKHISILVNNAGVRHNGSFLGTDSHTLQRVFDVNTFSPAAILRAVAQDHVAKRKTPLSVVTVSSILASFGPCNLSAYSASKAACMQLHEVFTQEVRRHSCIATLLVLPGQLDTRMFEDVTPSRQFLAPIVDHRRLARKIVQRIEQGGTGVLCAPLYANVLPVMKAMPMVVQRMARWFSQMDEKIHTNN